MAGLAQYAGTSGFIEEYTKELKKLSIQRELLRIGSNLQKLASRKKDPFQLVKEVKEEIKILEKRAIFEEKQPIKFLNQFDQNFLFEQPVNKPMLLEFIDSQQKRIGFLPRGIVAMLVGAGGVGKTHLLTQLAIAISTGTPWLNKFYSTINGEEIKKGNVFLGMGENQYEDIHRVLYKAAKKLRQDPSNSLKDDLLNEASKRIAVFSFCGQQATFLENKRPSLYFYNLKNKLIDNAPLDGWSLIILDPISRLLGADAETDNAAATQFIALLEELSMDVPGNPTILFSHHVNKSSLGEHNKPDQTAARGSSALTDGVRLQMNFIRFQGGSAQERQALLKVTKSNFTAFDEEIKLEREWDGYLLESKARNVPLKAFK